MIQLEFFPTCHGCLLCLPWYVPCPSGLGVLP
jgi:hypothetical protein